MPGAETTHITARFLAPDLIERGWANTLSCPLWASGAKQAPSPGGTVTIIDASGTEQVSAAAITITDDVATYSYTPAASLPLGEGWQVSWTLTAGGVTRPYDNDAALVRRRLHPVIADDDLHRRHAALNPAVAGPLSSVTSWQTQIDEAWAEIQLALIAQGNRPNLIMSPSSLREAHLCKTLELVFLSLSTRQQDGHLAMAEHYEKRYHAAWNRLSFLYDDDDDGRADETTRRPAVPSFWLGGRD